MAEVGSYTYVGNYVFEHAGNQRHGSFWTILDLPEVYMVEPLIVLKAIPPQYHGPIMECHLVGLPFVVVDLRLESQLRVRMTIVKTPIYVVHVDYWREKDLDFLSGMEHVFATGQKTADDMDDVVESFDCFSTLGNLYQMNNYLNRDIALRTTNDGDFQNHMFDVWKLRALLAELFHVGLKKGKSRRRLSFRIQWNNLQ